MPKEFKAMQRTNENMIRENGFRHDVLAIVSVAFATLYCLSSVVEIYLDPATLSLRAIKLAAGISVWLGIGYMARCRKGGRLPFFIFVTMLVAVNIASSMQTGRTFCALLFTISLPITVSILFSNIFVLLAAICTAGLLQYWYCTSSLQTMSMEMFYLERQEYPPMLFGFTVLLSIITYQQDYIRQQYMNRIDRLLKVAESSSNSKDTFIAVVSHEIRNPLNSILGSLHLLKDEMLSPQQQQLLDIAHTSGEILVALLTNVLDMAKMSKHKVELQTTPCDPAELFQNIRKLYQHQCVAKGLSLEAEVSPLPNKVLIDFSRFMQILVNVVGNSIKFTDKGSVSICAKWDTDVAVDNEHSDSSDSDSESVHTSSPTSSPLSLARASPKCSTVQEHVANRYDGTLVITVKDTGVGMEPATVRKLFHRFTQGDSTISRRFGGSGLGLYISRRLIEMMDGSLKCTETSVAGSTFEIRLPLRVVKQDSLTTDHGQLIASPIVVKPLHLSSLNVLVVDDIEDNRIVLGMAVSRWGCDISYAASGKEALDHLVQLSTDVVLLDLQMPEMDGFEMLKQYYKFLRTTGNVPQRATIFVVSGNATVADQSTCEQAGVKGFLSKPVQMSILRERLEEVVKTRHKSLQVLVVDDDMMSCHVMQQLLEKAGHTCTAVQSGIDAIETFKNAIFDLIILDLEMPDMSGTETAEAIREWERSNGFVPTLEYGLSGNVGDAYTKQALDAGMDCLLSKPIRYATLQASLESIIKSNMKQQGRSDSVLISGDESIPASTDVSVTGSPHGSLPDSHIESSRVSTVDEASSDVASDSI
eukprot:GILK01006649.1.p1 GENE.GILK01006649.1~~GILK01006649.1.p1  ORF type:complete len:844 (-),score=166.36 GILK01006649.1:269-2716(-)